MRIVAISANISRSRPDLQPSILGSLETDPYLGATAPCLGASRAPIDSKYHFVMLISSHVDF